MNLEQAIAAMKIQQVLISDQDFLYLIDESGELYTSDDYGKSWRKSVARCSDMLHRNFKIYQDPNEIEVGDHVQVVYFNDNYNWEVNDITPNNLVLYCGYLQDRVIVHKKYCKKVPMVEREAKYSYDPCLPSDMEIKEKKTGLKGWEAIKAFNDGKKVRRHFWGALLQIEGDHKNNFYPNASAHDLLSNDWEIVEC